MTETLFCKKCGMTLLPGTAFRTGGFCIPCYDKSKGTTKSNSTYQAQDNQTPEELYYQGSMARDAYYYAEALKLFREAAEKGHSQAQNDLGALYDTGRGVTQDFGEALKWYHKAAEHGNINGCLNLAMCYYIGRGVPQDASEAAKWWHLAAEAGNTEAQFNLGVLYAINKDDAQAAKWYLKAANGGYPKAQYALGAHYYNGILGITSDKNEALKWFRLAASQRFEDSSFWVDKIETELKTQRTYDSTPKMIKAYLIDPFQKTITAVEFNGDHHQIYEFIEGNCFDTAYFNKMGDHVYYRDDIGFSASGPGFSIVGYSDLLAGKGLVLGLLGSKSAPPTVDLQWLQENVRFCDLS